MLLIIFVVTLILRSPKVLKIAQESISEGAQKDGKTITSSSAMNAALSACLPLISGLTEIDKSAFGLFVEKLMNMSFIIGAADGDRFFTSDNPVYMHGCDETFELDEVVFPLTSRVVLFMYPDKHPPGTPRNIIVHLNNENVKSVNQRIILFSREWLYYKKELKSNQISAIEKIKEG